MQQRFALRRNRRRQIRFLAVHLDAALFHDAAGVAFACLELGHDQKVDDPDLLRTIGGNVDAWRVGRRGVFFVDAIELALRFLGRGR